MNIQLLLQTTTIITILGLIYLSFWDVKHKKIPTATILYLGTYGFVNQLLLIGEPKAMLLDLLITLGVSAGFFLLAAVSKQQLGMGDVLLYLVLALMHSWQFALIIYLVAFFLAGIFGLVLLIAMKKSKKTEVALVPFVLTGFLLLVLLP